MHFCHFVRFRQAELDETEDGAAYLAASASLQDVVHPTRQVRGLSSPRPGDARTDPRAADPAVRDGADYQLWRRRRVEGPRALGGAAGRLGDPLAADRRNRSPPELLARSGHDGRVGPATCRAWTIVASICRSPAARCPAPPSMRTCWTRPAGSARAAPNYTRQFPLLGASSGQYTINAQDWLIDDKWQYQRMGLPDNWERRIPVIYALAKAPAVAGKLPTCSR